MDANHGGPDLSGLRRLSPDAPPAKPPEAKINPIRVALLLLAAALVIAIPWIVFTKLLGDSGPVRPKTASTASPTPSASPSNPIAGLYEITGDIKCARVRIGPGTDQMILDCINPGVRVRADGRTEDLDGFTWLHIHDPLIKQDGWAASKYLTKVSS